MSENIWRHTPTTFPLSEELHVEAIAIPVSVPAIWAAAVARLQPAAVQVFDRYTKVGGEIVTADGGIP